MYCLYFSIMTITSVGFGHGGFAKGEGSDPEEEGGFAGDGDTGAGGAESLRAKAWDSSLRSAILSTKLRPPRKMVTDCASPLTNLALIVRPALFVHS